MGEDEFRMGEDRGVGGDELLTVNETAKLIGISPVTVRNAMQRGVLPYILRYEKNLIRRVDALAYRDRTQPDGVPRVGRPRKGAAGTDDEGFQ